MEPDGPLFRAELCALALSLSTFVAALSTLVPRLSKEHAALLAAVDKGSKVQGPLDRLDFIVKRHAKAAPSEPAVVGQEEEDEGLRERAAKRLRRTEREAEAYELLIRRLADQLATRLKEVHPANKRFDAESKAFYDGVDRYLSSALLSLPASRLAALDAAHLASTARFTALRTELKAYLASVLDRETGFAQAALEEWSAVTFAASEEGQKPNVSSRVKQHPEPDENNKRASAAVAANLGLGLSSAEALLDASAGAGSRRPSSSSAQSGTAGSDSEPDEVVQQQRATRSTPLAQGPFAPLPLSDEPVVVVTPSASARRERRTSLPAGAAAGRPFFFPSPSPVTGGQNQQDITVLPSPAAKRRRRISSQARQFFRESISGSHQAIFGQQQQHAASTPATSAGGLAAWDVAPPLPAPRRAATPEPYATSGSERDADGEDEKGPSFAELEATPKASSSGATTKEEREERRRKAQELAAQQRKKEGFLWSPAKPHQSNSASSASSSTNDQAFHHQGAGDFQQLWVVVSSGLLVEFTHFFHPSLASISSSSSATSAELRTGISDTLPSAGVGATGPGLSQRGTPVDLRFATARLVRPAQAGTNQPHPVGGRRFCFEVVTRSGRRVYQATSAEEANEWVGAILKTVESLINGTSSVRVFDPSYLAAGTIAPSGAGQLLGGRFPGASASQDSSRSLSSQATSGGGSSEGGHHQKLSTAQALFASPSKPGGAGAGASADGGLGTKLGNWIDRRPLARRTSLGPKHKNRYSVPNIVLPSGFTGGGGSGSRSRHESSEGSVHSSSRGGSGLSPLPNSSTSRHHQRPSSPSGGGMSSDDGDGVGGSGWWGEDADESKSTEYYDREIEKAIHTLAISSSSGNLSNDAAPRSPLSSQPDGFNGTGRAPTLLELRFPGPLVAGGSSTSGLSSSSNKERNAQAIADLAMEDGNALCADCRAPDPMWASWSLGIFICIECSGVHRSLGSHISKVRSVDLDDWSDEQLARMVAVGNERANAYWEAGIQSSEAQEAARRDAASFIKRKYIEKAFVAPPTA